jgi:hypothetical protein
MMHYLFGWGCFLALLVGALAPFPVGFKDQGRGPLVVFAFLVGMGVGLVVHLIRRKFKSTDRADQH